MQVDQQPYKVIEFLHVKPGKGAAFVRTKLKNYLTGNSVEKTFRGGEILSTADVQKKDGQFTYMDADEYVFMDTESYEETRLKRDDWANFLKEGSTCQLLFYNGKVISVDPPQFVDLKVSCLPHNRSNRQLCSAANSHGGHRGPCAGVSIYEVVFVMHEHRL